MEMDQAHHDIHYRNHYHDNPNQQLASRLPSSPLQQDVAVSTTAPSADTTRTTDDEQEVSFFHDFIAGGVAGSASVIIGHPMDTLKVRMQTAKGNPSIASLAIGAKYGGPTTLFRGVFAPLSAASAVNAIIFSSYGTSTRLWEQYESSSSNDGTRNAHPHLKAFACGSFAGLVQGLVICPMEHVKCRMQVQETGASGSNPLRTTLRSILTSGGGSYSISALYRGWWITCWREVPAFGGYFALYDIFKERIEDAFDRRDAKSLETPVAASTTMTQLDGTIYNNPADEATPSMLATTTTTEPNTSQHSWIASAIAGGLTGALTWAIVYPFDVIKTQIQTAPLDTPRHKRTILAVTNKIVKEHGWKHLVRGLSVTCLRAFPVNGIIFPVYEYTLLHVCKWET
ncbi:unnamed protein product [Pseudo-nitzschia multistriata]|uniref:Mitochondrial carrier protein n=1 Tax=Pseudo-nitzschia multistriata TaxID=183589 RepID=A0A448ZCL8_9STRA|nr:unnamed protein product [Pseudo-nitzschia multistriata]